MLVHRQARLNWQASRVKNGVQMKVRVSAKRGMQVQRKPVNTVGYGVPNLMRYSVE